MIIEVGELPHVKENARGVTAEKGDDNTKEDDEEVQLGSPSATGSKSLNFYRFDIK